MPYQPARWRRAGAAGLAACALATTAAATTAAGQTQTDEAAAGGQPGVSMSVPPEDRRVSYRERIEVRGAVSPAAPGRTVSLQYAPRGGEYVTVAETTTDSSGRYALSARPSQTGLLRAVADGGQASGPTAVSVGARPGAKTRADVRRGGLALVRGRLLPGVAGRTVLVQVAQRRGWTTVDRARTGDGGRFRAAWRPQAAGSYRVRVVFRGDRRNAPAARRARGRLNVYRPSHASWYGPGFYGNRTACGQTLGYGTLGVAHKWLPCGTRVTFRHGGRRVTVPVIDRGPYIAGREWDLTRATKERLGFGSTGTVWSNR